MDFWNVFRQRRKVDFFDLLLAQAEKTLAGFRALAKFLEAKVGRRMSVNWNRRQTTFGGCWWMSRTKR
jgi:hypothetical protein